MENGLQFAAILTRYASILQIFVAHIFAINM